MTVGHLVNRVVSAFKHPTDLELQRLRTEFQDRHDAYKVTLYGPSSLTEEHSRNIEASRRAEIAYNKVLEEHIHTGAFHA